MGQISIKVASSDGGLEEVALLAVQFLLWTASFSPVGTQETDSKCYLKMESFWFPIKYCEVIG